MLRGSSMRGVATCSEGSGAQGGQNVRGSSKRTGRNITGLYIASLHEIKDNFVSGLEFEKQLYILLEKISNFSPS
jgi:hypothetical protein